MQGVWVLSYAVDGQMDPQSCPLHHSCWPRIKNKVFENSRMLWMGRCIHNHAISTILVGPELEFRTLANVWDHSYAVDRQLWILHHATFATSRIYGVGLISWSQRGYKWCQGTMVEAPVPYGMVSTSTSNIYKAFEYFHMLWMGRWIHNHALCTVVVGPEL